MVEQQRNPVISQSKAPEILSSILTVLNMKQEVSANSSIGVFQTQHPHQHFHNFFAKSKFDAASAAADKISASSSLIGREDAAKSDAISHAAPAAAPGGVSLAMLPISTTPPSTSPPSSSSASESTSSPDLLPFFPVFDEGFRQTTDLNNDDDDDGGNNDNNDFDFNFNAPAGSR